MHALLVLFDGELVFVLFIPLGVELLGMLQTTGQPEPSASGAA